MLDKEKFTSMISGNDQFHGKLPQESLINLSVPGLQSGDILVVECDNLRESAQIYLAKTYDQLEEMEEKCR